MSESEYFVSNGSQYARELQRRIEIESRRVHAVLKMTRSMEMHPRAPVPHVRIIPVFVTWLLRFAAVPIGFAVSICFVAYHYEELNASSVAQVFGYAILYGGSAAAALSLITACTARMLEGEQMAHERYLVRVHHDCENAGQLIGYGEGTLRQAAALIKRQIDYVGDMRIFLLSLLGALGALTFSIVSALEVPKSLSWHGDAARFGVLCGILVTIGYFYSFRSLPRLRYQMLIIELAQQLERDRDAAAPAAQVVRWLPPPRRPPLRTVVGLVSLWLAGWLRRS